MQVIHEKISRVKLKEELTSERFVRCTNFGHNEIYDFHGDEAPNLMLEVGRLREISFREAGGGTGFSLDIDDFDKGENAYRQLIVWNPEEEEIVGGYRYIRLAGIKPDEEGHFHLATSHMFNFSEKFQKEYFSETIELGRSFVQPLFQPAKDSRKGVFSLDNLWDGLGAIIVLNPDIKYFFGKMTLYLKFNQIARDAIMFFLKKYFPDHDRLVYPFEEKLGNTDESMFADIVSSHDYSEDRHKLMKFVKSYGETVPPLFNAYMNLTPSMRVFGSSRNNLFGEVEEVGILVTIDDIYEIKKQRYITSFKDLQRND